jgi:hypothetical protein
LLLSLDLGEAPNITNASAAAMLTDMAAQDVAA